MNFTPDQQKVIDTRKKNILVSAAAGSGKTAVLVERICKLITDEKNPIDIDKLLVVTFTNAAAAEMRERIHEAILKKLENDPENENLLRQSILVNRAMIMTIDSFCRFILMNHFHEINLDPGFAIGDPADMVLLRKEAMGAVMEKAYTGEGFYEGFLDDFKELVNSFAIKARDERIESMIEDLYKFSESKPYPEKWLKSCLVFDLKEMWDHVNEIIDRGVYSYLSFYNQIVNIIEEPNGPTCYANLIDNEIDFFESVLAAQNYEEKAQLICSFEFVTATGYKKGCCDEDLKNSVLSIRNYVKDRFKVLKSSYCLKSKEQYENDVEASFALLKPLITLALEYSKTYADIKKRENVIDFTDMEHFALQILIDENEEPTQTALMYQKYFEEVMIDEYQDSNDVQELLLSVVSKEQQDTPNRFMVGDMKQSIYKFRLARPEIFLDKFYRYTEEVDQNVRIDLKQNFRSRKEVINCVNEIFYPLMGRAVGAIQYDEDAALYQGATYKDSQEDRFAPELLIYQHKDEEGKAPDISKEEGEALLLVDRIRDLIENGEVTDKETGELRPVDYDDIVILARGMSDLTNTIQQVFKREGIPCSVPSKVGFFSSIEVQTVLNFVKVCVNPHHDIPLAALLHSPFYNFSNDELAEIALIECEGDKKASFYKKMCLSDNPKCKAFLDELSVLRKKAKTETVHDFIYQYLKAHNYLNYINALPAGQNRRSNVEMLLEETKRYEKVQLRGIFGFIQYMKQLEKYEVDYGDGKDDGSKSVKLMTIHKSKGLEFPVCIVAGLGRKFNHRDLSSPVLMHADYGVAMQYRNYKKRTYRNTIRNFVMKDYLLADTMGEEIRVLYVALTRAREKLILTGSVDHYEKTMSQIRERVTPKDPKKKLQNIDSQLILDSNNFLTFLLSVYAFYEENNLFLPKLGVCSIKELSDGDVEKHVKDIVKKEAFMMNIAQPVLDDEKMNYTYPHPELQGLYAKTSVSDLKKAAMHIDEQTKQMYEIEETTSEEETSKKKLTGKNEVSEGALRGSATHRLMELLNFKKFDELDESEYRKEVVEQLNQVVSAGKLTKEEASLINLKKVVNFMKTELGQEMIEVDKNNSLFKEQPFVLSVEATRLDSNFSEDENVIIQGIIDAFYIKGDEVYLMDYKTDYVEQADELVSRYKVQLDYYKETLERITGKRVVKTMIYSFKLEETIEL